MSFSPLAGSSLFRPRGNDGPIMTSTFSPRPDSCPGRGKTAAVPSDPADVKRPRILVASDHAIEAPSRAERTPVPKQGPKPFMTASSGTHREHAGVALEIFCGSAGLSHACHCVGFRIIPIDWSGNKHASKVPVTKIDASTPEGQEQIWQMMADLPVKYVHLGPPCGTFSRAREIRIPEWALRRNAQNPKPL